MTRERHIAGSVLSRRQEAQPAGNSADPTTRFVVFPVGYHPAITRHVGRNHEAVLSGEADLPLATLLEKGAVRIMRTSSLVSRKGSLVNAPASGAGILTMAINGASNGVPNTVGAGTPRGLNESTVAGDATVTTDGTVS